MTDNALSRTDLHAALDALLDQADAVDGRTDADAFWEFVAGLAQGRGLTDALHEAGLEASVAVSPAPAKTLDERQKRAYHIGLLAALVMQVGRLPGQGSLLPANFQHGAIAFDLLGMLRGPSGMGDGAPLILTSARQGRDGLRHAARRQLVGVVYWRMGATGRSRAKVWEDLMGVHADKYTIDRWQHEFGGAKGELCQAAFAAGKAGKSEHGWSATNDELKGTIELVLSAPRRPKDLT